MDYLLFAIEEAQEQSSLVFEHGLPTAIVFTFLVCATTAIFIGIHIYENNRADSSWTGPNMVRANFNIEDLPETDMSRKVAKFTSIFCGVVFFVVSYAALFLPIWGLASFFYRLYTVFD